MNSIKYKSDCAKRYLALVEDAFVQGEFDFSGSAAKPRECKAKNPDTCPYHGKAEQLPPWGKITPKQKEEYQRSMRLYSVLGSKTDEQLRADRAKAQAEGDKLLATTIESILLDRKYKHLTDEGFRNLGERA